MEYFARVCGKIAIPVNPAYTSQICSGCGVAVKKDLKTRTHVCGCGTVLDRDRNAAINILRGALRMVGHTKTGEATPETLVEMEEDQPKLASITEARIPPL